MTMIVMMVVVMVAVLMKMVLMLMMVAMRVVIFGPSRGNFRGLSVCWGPLRAMLGVSRALLGPSRRSWGPCWGNLGNHRSKKALDSVSDIDFAPLIGFRVSQGPTRALRGPSNEGRWGMRPWHNSMVFFRCGGDVRRRRRRHRRRRRPFSSSPSSSFDCLSLFLPPLHPLHASSSFLSLPILLPPLSSSPFPPLLLPAFLPSSSSFPPSYLPSSPPSSLALARAQPAL